VQTLNEIDTCHCLIVCGPEQLAQIFVERCSTGISGWLGASEGWLLTPFLQGAGAETFGRLRAGPDALAATKPLLFKPADWIGS
jgi:hypothetical protein